MNDIASSWNKLLGLQENNVELDSDYHEALTEGGEKSVTEEEIENWLDNDEGDPSYQVMNEDEIVDSLSKIEDSDSASEGEESDIGSQQKMKLSEVKQHLNCVIDFVQQSENEEISAYYNQMRHLRALIVKEMSNKPQRKIDSYFKPKETNL